MTGQRIREALPCEFGQVADLTLAGFGGPDGLRPERISMLLDAAGRARDGLLLVAIDNETGTLTGTLSLLRAGTAYARHAGPGEAELRFAVVRPAYRHGGVARVLVTEAIKRARGWGVTALLADAAVHNEAPQRLLQQFGFCVLPPEKVRSAARYRPVVVFRYDLGATESSELLMAPSDRLVPRQASRGVVPPSGLRAPVWVPAPSAHPPAIIMGSRAAPSDSGRSDSL